MGMNFVPKLGDGLKAGIRKRKQAKTTKMESSTTNKANIPCEAADSALFKIIAEKSFDESVIDHFKLEAPFRGLGWVPLICISGEHYPDLVQEFHANMTQKTDKDLQTIISIVKVVRIVLDRECLAFILGILDNENTVIMDSIKKPLTRTRTRILMRLVAVLISGQGQWIRRTSTRAISHPFFLVPFLISSGTHLFKKGADLVKNFYACNVNFTRERRLSTGPQWVIKFTTFNNGCYSWDEKNKVSIPPFEEDRLWDRNPAHFRSIKKTTQIGIGSSSSQPVEDDNEADESYDPLDDEDDEADAQITIPMDAFQIEMRTAFEQL
ncbi:hypothetical protein M9H77_08181 [Catharanthus roseus]|uniref:Uncharacterized protein n=1 Tax=Catharanthus roseus TaxID=4058 RepID=A0ACC0BXE6_CATRO|nr:hypothetical protein M9H77_08181 [Catharanthus roseus]